MVGRCISYWNSPFLGDMLVFRGVSWSFVRRWNWFLSLQKETVQNKIVPYSTLSKFNMEPENDDFQVCNLLFQCDTKMEEKI